VNTRAVTPSSSAGKASRYQSTGSHVLGNLIAVHTGRNNILEQVGLSTGDRAFFDETGAQPKIIF